MFILESHRLEVSARLMNTGDEGEEELERYMVRPHMRVGDALLFDTRILHFGLSNESEGLLRPMLYVNYQHPSFRDPKNWNDAEKLFSVNEV